MNKLLSALGFLILFQQALNAQADYLPGFVQTTKRDTMVGFIDNRDFKANSISCKFRRTPADKVQTYKPTEIYGYRITDNKYYVSRKIIEDGVLRTLFLEYLVEGTVDLYYYRDTEGDHYLIGREGMPIKEISIQREVIRRDSMLVENSFLIKRELLISYLKDCIPLYGEIYQLKTPGRKVLINLIEKYHEFQCPDKMCLIYQKKLPKFRVDLQPVFGFVNVNPTGFDLKDKPTEFTAQYGLIAYFWLPLLNEKMFLKTGLLYTKVIGINTRYYDYFDPVYYGIHPLSAIDCFKVPLQLHYQFSNSDIMPFVSGGINIYYPFNVYPDFCAGLKAKITDKFYATLSADFDYYSPYFILPMTSSQYVSYSFNLGVAVKL